MVIKDYQKAAVYFGDEVVTYTQLIELSLNFSELIDISPGEKVVFLCENRPEWFFAYFGTLIRKCVFVAIDCMSSAEEVSFILNDCTPGAIVTSKEFESKVKEAVSQTSFSGKVFLVEDLRERSQKQYDLKEIVIEDTDDPAVMVYTSGTTGRPKGVVLTTNNISANIYGILGLKGMFKVTDVFGAILPFHHIYPLTGTIALPMVNGISVVIIEKLTSDVILGAFKKYGITQLFGIPRLYTIFHKAIMDRIHSHFLTKGIFYLMKWIPIRGLRKIIFGKVHRMFGKRLRFFFTGGSKINDKIIDDFKTLGIKMAEGYGLSETSPLSSANHVPGANRNGSIGRALRNVEIKSEDGELLIRGPHVMKGYYNRPEETAAALKGGWFHTGDAGYVDKQGYIFITGRKKELIALPNGKKINPEEIESVVLDLSPEMVQEIGVFAQDNGLFALIRPNFEFLKKNNLINIFETIRWQVIDKYNRAARDFKKILNFKIVTEELPKTRIGKLKRFMFPALLDNKAAETAHQEDPQEEQYGVLKGFMEKLTGKKVYADSHLEFDLGVDSLAKLELESFIESTFGVNISSHDFASNLNVIDIYRLIKERMTRMESGDSSANWGNILLGGSRLKITKSSFIISLFKFFAFPFFVTYLRIRTNGKKNLPTNPVIFAPNHQSFLDGMVLIYAAPRKWSRKTYFLANEKHFKKGVPQFIARHSNILTVNINVNLKEALQKSAAVLKRGKNIIIFPEGARTRDGGLMPFKKSFAILSKELNIPVVPVAIHGALKCLPVDQKFPKPGLISIDFLKPIYPAEKSYEEIVETTREAIDTKLKEYK